MSQFFRPRPATAKFTLTFSSRHEKRVLLKNSAVPGNGYEPNGLVSMMNVAEM